MGVSMGAAVRQLKLEISSVDIDLPEQDVSVERNCDVFLCTQPMR